MNQQPPFPGTEDPPFYKKQVDCFADSPQGRPLFHGVPMRCPLTGCMAICMPYPGQGGRITQGQIPRTSCKSAVDYQLEVDAYEERERLRKLAAENADQPVQTIGDVVGPMVVVAAIEQSVPETVELVSELQFSQP